MNQPQSPVNQAPMGSEGKQNQPIVSKWLWITFIIVILAGGAFAAWYFLMGPGKAVEGIIDMPRSTTTPATTTTTDTTSTTKSTDTAATTTPTATSTDLTYTNTEYGFTLTLPATWKGYKMKSANVTGETATYYMNVPTTDKSFTADTTADAGYYSPFAIGVYTLAQWDAVQAEEGAQMSTLIVKNNTYAFAWSQANGIPPTDWDKSADIKTIIASFKLTN